MAGEIWAFRVMRLALLDSDGSPIGRIEDVVLGPAHRGDAPWVLGFVASSQRRRIFVNAARVSEIGGSGIRLRSADIDVKHFKRRPGEILVSADLLDRRVGAEYLNDLSLHLVDGGWWEVNRVALGTRGPLRRKRTVRVVGWEEVRSLFDLGEVAAEVASFHDMHPSDVAALIRGLPLHRRRQLAEAMEDERLAEVLEELPEAEQLRIIEGLDLERLVSVLEEMEPDDAADLLEEMTGEQRTKVLEAMDADEAASFRMLLSFGPGTAGSLMTTDPVILGPNATVAAALATIRDPDVSATSAAQIFVTQAPWVTPTGRYLGVVHFQRLLREPPAMELGRCVTEEPSIPPDLSTRDVAERLAAYNLLAVAVTDDQQRLLGVVTVDDVLDHTLPAGWRQRQRALRQA